MNYGLGVSEFQRYTNLESSSLEMTKINIYLWWLTIVHLFKLYFPGAYVVHTILVDYLKIYLDNIYPKREVLPQISPRLIRLNTEKHKQIVRELRK